MTEHPSARSATKRPRRRRWWLRGVILLLLLVATLLLGPPLALRYGLRHWLLANGADRVEIGSVRVNPFTVAISLRDITIVRDTTPVLDHARVDLNIGLSRIINRQAYLQSIAFHHFNLDLEQDSEGRLRIGPYLLPAGTEPATEEPDTTGTPWIFRADRIGFVDSIIRYRRPDLQLALAIDQATLTRFTTEPGDKSGAFSFQGRINDAPISLELDTLRVLPDLVLQGTIRAAGLKCNWLDRLLSPWLNPFTGDLALAGRIGFASLSSGVMRVDYNGTMTLTGGDVGGRTWKTAGQTLTWKGTVAYQDVPEQAMTVATNGSLRGIGLRLDLPGHHLVLQEPDLELRGKTLVTIGDTVRVQGDSTLTGKGTLLDLPPYGYSDKGFRWQGSTHYDSGDAAAGLQVRAQGSLSVSGAAFAEQAGEHPLTADSREMGWHGRLEFQDTTTSPILTLAGTLTTRGAEARLGDRMRMEQETLRLTIDGSVHSGDQPTLAGTGSLLAEGFRLFSLPNDDDQPIFSLGSLGIDNISAPGGREVTVPLLRAAHLEARATTDLPMRITVPEIRMEHLHTTDLATASVRLLQLQSPRIVALVNGRELVHLGSVELKGLQAGTTGTLALHRLNFDELTFLDRHEKEGQQPVCRIAGATLAKIRWAADSGVSGDSLGFDGLHCSLVRRQDGSMDVDTMLAAMMRKRAPTDRPENRPDKRADATSGPVAIHVGSVIVRNKSSLHFEDHTLAVPFVSDLAVKTLQVTDIDSGHPDRPAHVRLMGTLENRAPLQVTGTIRPFARPLALAMKIKLKNYPLARLSAYTVQSVGTALAAGRLKLKTNLTIADDRLDMRNRVVLKKLQTRTISPELAKKLDNRLPLPLDSALAMLRDRKGNISLDLPVKGPLSNLRVGIGDILITALGKAIVPAASSYLVYALGPYAALAYVGVRVGEKMMQVSLPPVPFTPGSAGIDDKQKKYLERIATLLKNRPRTDLQLMPVSTPQDLAPGSGAEKRAILPPPGSDQEKTLLALGQQRAEALRDYLATTWSIDRNRLMISMTRLAAGNTEKPRVELQL